MDSTIISDPLRVPITVQKRTDGGVVLRGHRDNIILSETELDRLFAFARDKAVLQRFPIAPKTPLAAPQGDE
jgi:hypothetical protein